MVSRRNRHIALVITVCLLAPMALSGCSVGGGTQAAANANVRTTTSTTYAITTGARNSMADGSLQLTVTGVQRRPVSTFTNVGDQSGDDDSNNDEKVAIEVDLSYTFNQTTLTTNAQQAGSDDSSNIAPKSLSDLLMPGELMYITGTDADGNAYISTDVLDVSTSSSNTLGTNAQWDYNALDADLPQAATTKTGSMVFTVSSQASDLTLHIITANQNADPLDADSVASGNNYHYTLDLS